MANYTLKVKVCSLEKYVSTTLKQNDVAGSLALLFLIREVPCSDIGSHSGCPV